MFLKALNNCSNCNNIELRFYRSTLDAACKEIMWAGIFSLNPFSGIYLDGSVNVFHAKTGIKSENGGQVHVSVENVFDNNNIGILVQNAQNVQYNFFTVSGGNQFSNTEGSLFAPFNTLQANNTPTRRYSGISIKNVLLNTTYNSSNIIIGDATADNIFSDSYYGIEIRDAAVTVTPRNYFSNHKKYHNTNYTQAGAALLVNASPGQTAKTALIYSGTAATGIQIENCNNGLLIQGGRVDVNLSGVKINEVYIGIKCTDLKYNGLVRISNCDVTECQYGIWCSTTQNNKYIIAENRIYNKQNPYSFINKTYGIYIDELPVNVFSYTIRCNLIFPASNGVGIYLRGTNKATQVIKNNIVNTHSGNYSQSFEPKGIEILNASATSIIENEISTTASGMGGYAYSRGLYALKNSYLNIRCNNFTKVGTGMFLNMNNQSSTVLRNTFNDNITGTRFQLNHNIDLGVPGQYHGGNQWTNINTWGIVNASPNGSLVNVYATQPNLPSYPTGIIYPNNNSAPYINIIIAPPNCPNTKCHNQFEDVSANEILLDSTELAIANSIQQAIPNLDENEIEELRRLLFRHLLESDTTIDSDVYEDFIEYMRETENGQMALIADSLRKILSRADSAVNIITLISELETILSLLEAYNTENLALLNEKTVLRIYVNYLIQLSDALSETDFNNLLAIAQQCPLTGGLAVYSAQTILKDHNSNLIFETDSLCALTGYRIEVEFEDSNHTSHDLIIYPNPAKDFINIISNKSMDNIKIYSITGVLILNAQPNSSVYRINTSDLNTGLYFISIISGSNISNKKIQFLK